MLIANIMLNVFGSRSTGEPGSERRTGENRRKATEIQQQQQDDPPFILVAHDRDGQWDVYARHFDTPVASFGQREPACSFATGLASARSDCLVLLRENYRPPAQGHLN